MEQADIYKLISLREAWDKFKSVSTANKTKEDYDAFYEVFWAYGYENKAELIKFNDEMCLKLLEEQYTIRGECDLCEGIEGVLPCEKILGATACGATREPLKMSDTDKKQQYFGVLLALRIGIIPPKNGESKVVVGTSGKDVIIYTFDNKFTPRCPPNHGFYFDYSIPIEEHKPFDLTWVP